MNYCIIIGTNRPNSYSKKVAQYYKQQLSSNGFVTSEIDLKDVPEDFIFTNMYGNKNPSFEKFQSIIDQSDKFIFVLPEYNGSFPGILKAFIDACRFPDSFANKKCCLVGLSAGQFGNLRGLEHFSGIANYCKMDVLHNKIYLPGVQKDLDEDGVLNNEHLVKHIGMQLNQFIEF